MIIKISKGEIHLKDNLNVRDYYTLMCWEEEVMGMSSEKGAFVDGEKIMKLKEKKVMMAIEKIIIDGKEKEVKLDTLLNDEYVTIDDFKKIFEPALKHICSLQNQSNTSKKS